MTMKTADNSALAETDRTQRRLLVVEDDEDIRSLITRYLRANDFDVSVAGSATEMDRVLARGEIDLVVLDVNLPGEDGFSICMRLRNAGGPPVIILTARGEEMDRILGLELGADDYLVKPFVPRELLARIRAVLRRSAPATEPDVAVESYEFDGFRLDLRRRHLFGPTGTRIILTGAEFDLLLFFCQGAGRVFSREQLKAASTSGADASTDRSVDILVSRLRQKIEQDPRDPMLVQTVRSVGYTLVARVARK
jgi:two-component system, OmpR family, response regulator